MVDQVDGGPYISICGPIASGKTTMARLLSQRLGLSLLLEDLDANPYIQDYYGDMHRWGFHTVTAFLARSLDLALHLPERLKDYGVCQDWHFAEHYGLYGVHVFEEGIIDDRERQLCEELDRTLLALAPPPDLTMVLTAPPAILLGRIEKRARPGEATVPVAYIEHLVSRYRSWAELITTPKIILDTGSVNYEEDPIAAADLVDTVRRALRKGESTG